MNSNSKFKIRAVPSTGCAVGFAESFVHQPGEFPDRVDDPSLFPSDISRAHSPSSRFKCAGSTFSRNAIADWKVARTNPSSVRRLVENASRMRRRDTKPAGRAP